jgi:hypothetical protein
LFSYTSTFFNLETPYDTQKQSEFRAELRS